MAKKKGTGHWEKEDSALFGYQFIKDDESIHAYDVRTYQDSYGKYHTAVPGVSPKLMKQLTEERIRRELAENLPQSCSVLPEPVKHTTMDTKRRELISQGILAAAKLTNVNLISMDARIARTVSRNPDTRRQLILQSEALSIFKGNVTRIFKQICGSHEVNVIKRDMRIELNIRELDGYPVISWVNANFFPPERLAYEYIRAELKDAFKRLNTLDLHTVAQEAIDEYKQKNKDAVITTPSNPADINFDSIKSIKF